MTVQKSFKRLVRARMAKTGESYTAARAQLLAGDRDRTAPRELPYLACSDDRIRERTGRGWEEWFALLDSWGTEEMTHADLARQVATELDRHPLAWDTQAITASFERSRGKRAVGERVGREGFVASASRTIHASAKEALAAFVDPSRRATWLPDVALSERTVKKANVARFDVAGGPTRLTVSVDEKGPAKVTVTVEHSRLAGSEDRERCKAQWQAALLALKADLEEGTEALEDQA